MNTENNHPHPLMVIYRVMLSLPLAVCWMLTFAVLCAGWGLSRGDKFIELWNSVVVDEDDDHPCGPDGCGNDDDKCFCNVMQNG